MNAECWTLYKTDFDQGLDSSKKRQEKQKNKPKIVKGTSVDENKRDIIKHLNLILD